MPLIVLTGGPGAGKTAVLEVVRKHFCDHVEVLSESAGIVFGGGFPRRSTPAAKRAAQRAIFGVQREIERLAIEESRADLVLCDRGTL
ncbi:MAG TPA: AAA family ATPase, partial [Minicystis sp.]|nr:AAA family ATPase [Minicystis sp.]